ncbi:hypothetical protein MNBD_GAMMA22-2416 [hydrothermal vent metagenome]|uniref:PA2779 family protein n=1 Tax=hydrothermal vent metagenome TaxID=652676 RepID=A0A3B0ZMB3_9ZZZZ
MNLFFCKVSFSRLVVTISLICFSLNVTVSAALVTTLDSSKFQQSVGSTKELVLTQIINRIELQQQLVAFGVDSEQAQLRLNSMTDAEIATLASDIKNLPAGGDALTIIAVIFLVLLFTDIAGYTDLFPFVKKTARNSPQTQRDGEVIDRRVERKRKEPVVIEN